MKINQARNDKGIAVIGYGNAPVFLRQRLEHALADALPADDIRMRKKLSASFF